MVACLICSPREYNDKVIALRDEELKFLVASYDCRWDFNCTWNLLPDKSVTGVCFSVPLLRTGTFTERNTFDDCFLQEFSYVQGKEMASCRKCPGYFLCCLFII